MDLKNILPSLGRKNAPVRREDEHPFAGLQHEMNRLFDVFFQDWGITGLSSAFSPRIDMSEDETSIGITAELPGMSDKDIEVSLSQDMLTIRGEKKDEREESGKNYFYSERSFGSFSRTIRIPRDVNADKVQAEFRKGVLTITAAKTAETGKQTKKIPVKTG